MGDDGHGAGKEECRVTGHAAARLEALEAENLRLRLRAVDLVEPARIAVWLGEPARRPANTAFTAGPERDLARAIEDALAAGTAK